MLNSIINDPYFGQIAQEMTVLIAASPVIYLSLKIIYQIGAESVGGAG